MKRCLFLLLVLLAGCVQLNSVERHERSPHWRSIRRVQLQLHPKCAVCCTTNDLEVHHVNLFNNRPDLELTLTNLITLCRGKANHHFHVGHKGVDWNCENLDVWRDVAVASNLLFRIEIYTNDWRCIPP